jgi:uncharacterized membrane protein
LPKMDQPRMPGEVEQSIQIKAPHTRVYDILLDVSHMPTWDPTAHEVVQVKKNKYMVRTGTLGTVTLVLAGAVPYDRISWHCEGSLLQSITFLVGLASNLTQVDVTGVVAPPGGVYMVKEALSAQLISLKRYAEYITMGGNPDAYKKEETLASIT